MKKLITISMMLCSASFSIAASQGIIKYESHYSVAETVDRFEKIAKKKGLTLFARIDHQKNALNAGLVLRPTQVVIFGNPKVGTPLMLCAQDVAIDLPQKIMVMQDVNNKVWLSYNSPNYLMKRHHIKGCESVINKVSSVLGKLSKAAVSK